MQATPIINNLNYLYSETRGYQARFQGLLPDSEYASSDVRRRAVFSYNNSSRRDG